MNTQNVPPAAQIGDNSGPTLSDLDKVMAKLGGQSVNVARPKLAIALVGAASIGLIGEADVEARYDAYLAGREKAQSKTLLAAGVDDGNGKKANVSKCRQLVRMAMLPLDNGPDLIDRTTNLRGNMVGGDEKIEAPFDAFLKVARAQIAQPDEPLSDDQIMAEVRKPVAKDKSEVEQLIKAYNAARKLADTVPMPQTEAAVDAYRDAIVEAGGEVPLTKEEKEMAAFYAKAASMGFAINNLAAE